MFHGEKERIHLEWTLSSILKVPTSRWQSWSTTVTEGDISMPCFKHFPPNMTLALAIGESWDRPRPTFARSLSPCSWSSELSFVFLVASWAIMSLGPGSPQRKKQSWRSPESVAGRGVTFPRVIYSYVSSVRLKRGTIAITPFVRKTCALWEWHASWHFVDCSSDSTRGAQSSRDRAVGKGRHMMKVAKS